MSTAPFTPGQFLRRSVLIGLSASVLACSGGGDVSPEPSAFPEPLPPPTGSYEDFTPEELVRVFDLRESEVPQSVQIFSVYAGRPCGRPGTGEQHVAGKR